MIADLSQAVASLLWAVVMNISARRANHSMSHVPAVVNTIVQLILALGATACFAILIYHMENYPAWNRSLEGSMIALLVILAYVDSCNNTTKIWLISAELLTGFYLGGPFTR
jgi:hypothetical protein